MPTLASLPQSSTLNPGRRAGALNCSLEIGVRSTLNCDCRKISRANSNHVVAPALEILGAIRAPLYGIPGNHDHWSRADFGPIRTAFAATGGAWLQNQQILIRGGAVNLMGVDRLPAQVATDPSRFNLLMVHYPEWADRLGDLRCDLAIAGHSHGGQVRLPFGGALITPHNTGRYEMGLYDAPVGPLYVNPGIGTVHIDVRFNCRPEITLFEV